MLICIDCIQPFPHSQWFTDYGGKLKLIVNRL